ncbi:hypothetical protein GN958_ATG12159 [Phytophthora infestans]|nr:hypothetical protein GN958_ATG12159 [Phytophthora infestans]KAI9980742.1 hypothetical protein PInf_010061 [Phytophthora infestans]
MSTRRNTLYQAAADGQANQNAPLPQGVADQDVPVLNPALPPAVQAAPLAAARGAHEPDDEPNPALIAGVGDERTTKRTEKVDLRNVKSEAFSGAVPPGAYDSGFADQVEDAQVLAGQEWTESVKKSALSVFLTGSARRWLRSYRKEHPAATFEEAGVALIDRFRLNLTDQEITARIYSEGKRASETYQEYADRLLQMSDGLTGGIGNAASVQHALGTFLRLAWPQRKDIVQAHARGKIDSPTSILSDAVQFLSELSQSDGRLEDYKRRKLSDGSRALRGDTKSKTTPLASKPAVSKPKGKAHVAVVERKRKVSRTPSRSAIVCFICGEEGHTAKYHREHLSKSSEDSPAQGHSATAQAEESAVEDESSDNSA